MKWISRPISSAGSEDDSLRALGLEPGALPLAEWRGSLLEKYSAEAVDRAIANVREGFSGFDFKSRPDGTEEVGPIGRNSVEVLAGTFDAAARAATELSHLVAALPPDEAALVGHTRAGTGTIGGPAPVVLEKYRLADSARRQALANYGRPPARLVYFGSADDVETAALTGAAEIALVDPALSAEVVGALLARLRGYAEDVAFDEATGRLSFRVGGRAVSATVFPEAMEEYNQRGEPQAEAVLLFNKTPWMDAAEARKALTSGGIFLDNRGPTTPPEAV